MRFRELKKSHAIENFRIAAGEAEGEFYGQVFQDSDLAKWMEGAAYASLLDPSGKIEKSLEEVQRLVKKAQEPDGYLDTYFIIKGAGKKDGRICWNAMSSIVWDI